MTEEEHRELKAAKAAVSAGLAAEDVDGYGLDVIDVRLRDYVRSVADNPTEHNLYEQLAALRFLRMVRRYGLRAGYVRRFIAFYEMLRFPATSGGRSCYKLTPVQVFQFAAIYGFWQGTRRVVREACLYVPRKFSKTTSSAAFALFDLFFGDSNAECYTAANSADQAAKCFDVIRRVVMDLDPKGRRYLVNQQVIKSKRPDRDAMAQCLTANSRTKDGLNASTVIMDEFSQARDMSLLSVLTTSMGVRENPLTVIITTASDVFDGPFYSMLRGYKDLLLGKYDDDGVFAHLFEPDVDDADGDPATWRKVQPHLGITVRAEYYAEEYKRAQRAGAEYMLAFRTKMLNVYTENECRAWISATLARTVSMPVSSMPTGGRPDAVVAIDLSVSGDFSAVTYAWFDEKETHRFYYVTDYFFPRGALPGHPNEKLYRGWAQAGYLHLLDGDVIDYRAIVAHIKDINTRVRVVSIGYDAYHAKDAVNMLENSGGDGIIRAFRQTNANFTAPTESFEVAIKTGRGFINDNPINFYCFGNAVLDIDNMGNMKPVKRQENYRIDGVITTVMAHGLILDYRDY